MTLRQELSELSPSDTLSAWELSLAQEMAGLYYRENPKMESLEVVKRDWGSGYFLGELESFSGDAEDLDDDHHSITMANERDLEEGRDQEWWFTYFRSVDEYFTGPWEINQEEMLQNIDRNANMSREFDHHVWAWHKEQMLEFFAGQDPVVLENVGYAPVTEDQAAIIDRDVSSLELDRDAYCNYRDQMNRSAMRDGRCFGNNGQKLHGAEEALHFKEKKEERERFAGDIISWVMQASQEDIYREMPRLKQKLQESRQRCLPPKSGWRRDVTYSYRSEILLTKPQVEAIRAAVTERLRELEA